MIHLDHLTISVRNLGESRDWYTSVLGLEVEFEVPQHRACALKDSGGFTLFIQEDPAGLGNPSSVLTFRVEDVESKCRELNARHIRLQAEPQKLFWGFGAELRDPSGYLIRLWDERSMREKG
jgi:catechol 2,3-dioxygenase-like lactoylglutathione lyase family enzyme